MIDLDDILNDDSLFEDFESDDSLFNTKRYRRTVTAADKVATRQRVKSGFDYYQRLFQAVQADIASGKRQIISISKVEISQKSPIKQGNFYIDNGIMLYVNKIYNPKNGQEVSESTNRKYKVHTVYANGTENHIWLLSLISSLYDKKRSGQLVTERLEDISLLSNQETDYRTTGYIYVVKYAGQDQQLLQMKNLYKIGVATNIKQRLANTVNEATYLFAPVTLVKSFEIQNIDARKIETYLHHTLADKRIELSTISPRGKEIKINEWFIVNLDEIDSIINKMIVEVQKQ
ncbi:GIY-YIG nuclease family protein [Streptococcus halotolerans]|uniref:GIY-YIG nuclease family protein n=1 Tax=Streptococcus halotolerans TaxID=1814128 RepID=UPI0007869623|nr:GIY-YIG nuclease family protein [Streptococcus halotolerans]